MSQASFKHPHKRSQAFAALVALCLFSSLLPTRAYAVFVPTNDLQLNGQKILDLGKELGLDGLLNLAAQVAIDQLTQSIVGWVKGGNDGNPFYITDLSGFLYDIETKKAHQNAAMLRATRSCYTPGGSTAGAWVDPDTGQVVGGGGSTWIDPDTGLPRQDDIVAASIENAYGRTQNVTCPFSDGTPFRSVEQDGWSGFVASSFNPKANAFAGDIYIQEKIAREQQIAREQALAEASWNRGYLSVKNCDTPDGTCVTKTPGSVLESQTNTSLSSGLRKLELADEIDEMLSAVMTAAVERVFSEADGLFSNALSSLPGGVNTAIKKVTGVDPVGTINANLNTLKTNVSGLTAPKTP